jgi:hypothetical protein
VGSREEAALWRPRERVFGLAVLAVSLKKLSPEGIMSFTAKAALAAAVSVLAAVAIGAGIMALRDGGTVSGGAGVQDPVTATTTAAGATATSAKPAPSLEAFDRVTSYRAVMRHEPSVVNPTPGSSRPPLVAPEPLDAVAEVEGKDLHIRVRLTALGDIDYIKIGASDYTNVGGAWTSDLVPGIDYATLRQADIRPVLNLLTLIPSGKTDVVEGKACELFDGVPIQVGEGGTRYSVCVADDLPLRLVAQAFQTKTVITLTSFNEKFDIRAPTE